MNIKTKLLILIAVSALVFTGLQPSGRVEYPDACYQDNAECHVDRGEIILEYK